MQRFIFEGCDRQGEPYTITGLALALDTSRRVLSECEKDPKFSNARKRAKGRCENWIELNALRGKINPTFAIFALKNHGWSDRQEFGHSGDSTAKTVLLPAKLSVEEWEETARKYRNRAGVFGSWIFEKCPASLHQCLYEPV